jgi:hypothetical protein
MLAAAEALPDAVYLFGNDRRLLKANPGCGAVKVASW